jgi:hypothetical protein
MRITIMANPARSKPLLVRLSLAVFVLTCAAWVFGWFMPSAFCFNTGNSEPCDVSGYANTWVTNYGVGLLVERRIVSLAVGRDKTAVNSGTPLESRFTWVRFGKFKGEFPTLIYFTPNKFAGFGFSKADSREGGDEKRPPFAARADLSASVPLWFLVLLSSVAPVKYWFRRRKQSAGDSAPEMNAPAHEPFEERRAA